MTSLMEKLIVLGPSAYPRFGNVVILAGGAGSGKGFVKDKLVGVEGKEFDVDALKTLAAKAPKIRKRVKEEFDVDIQELANNLKNPDNVGKLHDIIGGELRLDKKKQSAIQTSILTAHPDRRPNLIFDVTLKNLQKLSDIARWSRDLGYDPKNIHIVWVVNDIEVAKAQNAKRARQVPLEILLNTHRGVSQTMADIIGMGKSLSKYMDGDIVFAFNKVGVDSEVVKSGKGGSFIKSAEYFYAKKRGKPVKSLKELGPDVIRKIQSYVPKNVEWVTE